MRLQWRGPGRHGCTTRSAWLAPDRGYDHRGHAVDKVNGSTFRVAKKQIASTLDVVLSEKRISVPAADPLAEVFIRQLRDFSVKVTANGTERFAALDRVGAQDDLVMAAGLAVWRGENRPQQIRVISDSSWYAR